MTRHDVFQNKPASVYGNRWKDATCLGNGHTGVAFYGGISNETLIFHRADMWHAGKETPVPDVTGALNKMRKLHSEGKDEEACNVMYDALNEAGYETNAAIMRTLGQIKFRFSCNGVYSHYRRILHMDTGEAEVCYQLGKQENKRFCFVSRKRDMVVLKMMFAEPTNFSLIPGFFNSYEGGSELYIKEQDEKYAEYSIIDQTISYTSKHEGKYFGIVSKIISDGVMQLSTHEIKVRSAKEAVVFMKTFSGEKNCEKAKQYAISTINNCPQNYEELFKEHRRLHKKLYSSADMKLYHGRKFHSNEELLAQAREDKCPLELAEKLWRYGRYLFISGVSKDGLPFPLYGLWPCGYDRIFSQHVGNENIEMIHWHTVVGGLSELNRPLVNFYCDKTEGFRENARNLYGCSGIFIGAYLTPCGERVAPHVPVILHFLGVAGWICAHMYAYYLQTKDEKLFSEKILPFMVETAAFYEDYVYEDQKGNLILYPAVSPENTPSEYMNVKRVTLSGHPMPVTENPTIEFAIMKEVLTNLIAISENRPALQTKAEKWRKLLAKIPEYIINEDGAIAEWMDGRVHDNYEHRHLSHVYPLFPGTEIEESGKENLLLAFKKAVDLRRLGYMTGWSLVHMAAIYARLKEGDKLFNCLNMLTKVCLLDNFFTLHNDFRDMGITVTDMGDENYAPVQLDALLGTVNALQEMLLYVSPKKIKLLPACPSEFNQGEAFLHYYDGSIKLQWDLEAKTYRAEIMAIRDTDIIVELPFGQGSQKLRLSAGEKMIMCM